MLIETQIYLLKYISKLFYNDIIYGDDYKIAFFNSAIFALKNFFVIEDDELGKKSNDFKEDIGKAYDLTKLIIVPTDKYDLKSLDAFKESEGVLIKYITENKFAQKEYDIKLSLMKKSNFNEKFKGDYKDFISKIYNNDIIDGNKKIIITNINEYIIQKLLEGDPKYNKLSGSVKILYYLIMYIQFLDDLKKNLPDIDGKPSKKTNATIEVKGKAVKKTNTAKDDKAPQEPNTGQAVKKPNATNGKAVKKPNAGQVDNEPNTTNGKAVKKTNTGKDGKAPQEPNDKDDQVAKESKASNGKAKAPQEPNDKDDQVTKESKASNGNVDKSVKGQVAKGGKLISKKSKIIKNKKT